MTGINNKVLAVIRGFLDLSDDDQGHAMEILSEYYIADASARDNFLSEARRFTSRDTGDSSEIPHADVKPRHHKIY
ncbi:MAG: hypothetical protein ACJ73D_00150 [Pyrinomonadaceae bacterium]